MTYEFEGKKYQVYQAYAHAQEILVNTQETIMQGQQIAIMGGSGDQSDEDYPPHVDLSTYILMGEKLVQLNPQTLDMQLAKIL